MRERVWPRATIKPDRLTITVVKADVPIRIPARRVHDTGHVSVSGCTGLLPNRPLSVICSSRGPIFTYAGWPRWTKGRSCRIAVSVVDEDRSVTCGHVEVVVVVAGDGEVPHPSVVDGRDRTADHDRHLAVGGLEMHARFEVFCGDPAVVQIRCVDWTNRTLVMNLRTP